MLSLDAKRTLIILILLTLLATIVVTLRIILRWQKHILALDDFLIAFALIMVYLQDAGALLREYSLPE